MDILISIFSNLPKQVNIMSNCMAEVDQRLILEYPTTYVDVISSSIDAGLEGWTAEEQRTIVRYLLDIQNGVKIEEGLK